MADTPIMSSADEEEIRKRNLENAARTEKSQAGLAGMMDWMKGRDADEPFPYANSITRIKDRALRHQDNVENFTYDE